MEPYAATLAITALLLTLIMLWRGKADKRTSSYRITYTDRKRYPLELFVKLYERAVSAAGAWVDDVDPDAYLGVEYAKFFVKENVICVRVFNAQFCSVDVFFSKQGKDWQRADIFYGGEKIR